MLDSIPGVSLLSSALYFSLLSGLVGASSVGASEERAPDPRLVAELIGLEYCESLPTSVTPAELVEGVVQMESGGMRLIAAQVDGFMASAEVGGSVFGTSASGTSFTAVHSLWGVLPDDRMATMCLHMVQIGDVPATPGAFTVHGLQALEGARVAFDGDVVMSGIVIILEDTGTVNAGGFPILRQRTIGDVNVHGGDFILDLIDGETYRGSPRLEAEVVLEDGESAVALRIDAALNGYRDLERVPTLTGNTPGM